MRSALHTAFRCQLFSLLLILAVGKSGLLPPLEPLALAALQALCAAFLSLAAKAERWWAALHLAFLPAVVLAVQLHLPPKVYGAAFLILLCVYWTTFRTRVPLFLSNRTTVYRFAARFSEHQEIKVLDVGSGTGSFIQRLAQLRPDWQITGCELAPAPFLISRWRARHTANLDVRRQDFWAHSFAPYDMVYAFLSPAPMTALWRKVRQEMRPGTLLISNSFEVPDLKPEFVIHIEDRRRTQLFCYRIPTRGR